MQIKQSRAISLLAGAASALFSRALLSRLLYVKFTRDVKRLNAGDYSPLLSAYAVHAVLHFNDGVHRWSGDWSGKPNIERFLQNFTAAGVTGEIGQIAFSGPPWALTLMARFDDHADGPAGTRLYENQTALVLETKWGRIVRQQDFYVDTGRILDFERELQELGVEPIAKL